VSLRVHARSLQAYYPFSVTCFLPGLSLQILIAKDNLALYKTPFAEPYREA